MSKTAGRASPGTRASAYRGPDALRTSLFLGLGLLSASGLALELVIIRIFSVILVNHFAYIALGIAVAGLGIGAAFAAFIRPDFAKGPSLAALMMGLSLALTRWVPAGPSVLFYGILWGLPFIPIGWTITGIFQSRPSQSGRLYAVDLLGAGVGALFSWLILHRGAAEAVLVIAGTTVLAGLILRRVAAPAGGGARMPLVATSVVILLAAGQLSLSLFNPLPIAPSPLKDRLRATSREGARLVGSRWSPFGRTDAVWEGDGQIGLYVDGAAGAVMLDYEEYGDPESRGGMGLARSPGSIPLRLTTAAQRDSALIIGAGGGRDVLLALQSGFRHITAVEVNPEIVRLGLEMSDFNGGIFTDGAGVRLVRAEGRAFTEGVDGRFDAIFIGLPLTKSSRAPYGYALTENFLITVESIRTYWDRLTPEGQLIIVAHGTEEIYRLILTSIAALRERGLETEEVLARTLTIPDHMNPVWVLAREPVSEELAMAVHEVAHPEPGTFHGPGSWVPHLPTRTEWHPLQEGYVHVASMLDPALAALAEGRLEPEALGRVVGTKLTVPTDSRPFFFKEEPGLPRSLWIMVLFSLLLLLLAAILHTRIMRRPELRRTTSLVYVAGASLGTGYLMIEVGIFQQFTLALGSPTLSTTLLLPLLLAGSAAGALWISSRKPDVGGIPTAMAWAVAAALVAALLLGPLVAALNGQAGLVRLGAASVATVAIGIVLGVPFPRLLRWAGERVDPGLMPAVWTGNALGSVLGSALGLSLSVLLGFQWVLLSGGLLYTVGVLAGRGLVRVAR